MVGFAGNGVINGGIVAPPEDRARLRYAGVIAWRTFRDEDDREQLRAWLSGVRPIPSDRFHEECRAYFMNHYTPFLPPNARMFVWA